MEDSSIIFHAARLKDQKKLKQVKVEITVVSECKSTHIKQ